MTQASLSFTASRDMLLITAIIPYLFIYFKIKTIRKDALIKYVSMLTFLKTSPSFIIINERLWKVVAPASQML